MSRALLKVDEFAFVASIHSAPQRYRFIPHSGRAQHPRLEGLDAFAEYLAEDCSPTVAARLAGYEPGDAEFLLKLIGDKLGDQAK